MRTVLQDLRYGIRVILSSPGVSVVAVLALALGVGANTAIFSVVNAVLLRPLPYPHPEQLVSLYGTDYKRGNARDSESFLDYRDLRDQNHVFSNLAAFSGANGIITGNGQEPEQLDAASVTANIFATLGVNPALGRTFTPAEEEPKSNPVAVISHSLWQRRFGSDPSIIGREITLDSSGVTVVGVMPAGFTSLPGLIKADIYLPIYVNQELYEQRAARYLVVIGRLKEGVTLSQAQAELSTIVGRLEQLYPEMDTGRGVRLIKLSDDLVAHVRPTLLMMLGAVGFVLLIACANVANLLLGRATRRARELAIRTALGASRWRLVRQLLTESVLLSLIGGGLGLLLTLWCVDLLIAAIPAELPRMSEISIDRRVLFFTLALSVATGFVFGLVPALSASRSNLNEMLKEGGRSATEGGRRHLMRSALVVTEIALSLLLLIGAGLFLKSFAQLTRIDPGFRPDRVLTASVSLPEGKYDEDAGQAEFFQRALERISALPGVDRAGAIFPLPLGGDDVDGSFAVEGRPGPSRGESPIAEFFIASPGYFQTMGIPLRGGRVLSETDNAVAPKVLVINETLARRFFPAENPIGKRLTIATIKARQVSCEIIGVVGDVRERQLDLPPQPQYYVSYLQFPMSGMSLVARAASGDPTNLVSSLRAGVRSVDSDQPIAEVKTMNQLMAEAVARQRFSALLLSLFSLIALVLAAVGTFSVMSFSVAQRTHEIGIRMALGAQVRDVLRMIVGQGLILASIGIAVGVLGAVALTRVLADLLFNVSATDPLIFIGVSALLFVVSLVACYLPARRAARVDPTIALRYE